MTPAQVSFRKATDKQLAKISMICQKDWNIDKTVKEYSWQKDLSILGIQQASRLINYLTYYQEHPGYMRNAYELMNRLPNSESYKKLKSMETKQ